MWRIYDELIAAVPEDSVVSACMIGLHWILVRSEGVGVALTPQDGPATHRAECIAGMKTRDLARWVKSWNFMEAAIGLAAINSALNEPGGVERRYDICLDRTPSENLFDHLAPQLEGKRVTVVGHFYGVERLAEIAQLSVLERRPLSGDLPDPACEYMLADQDVVIMTATTLINKTMPRLLQLSRNARVVVCGPSTPLLPALFDQGVDVLAGLVVEDEPLAWRCVQEGIERGLLRQGTRMIQLAPASVRAGDPVLV
jgi:hypothetical protein